MRKLILFCLIVVSFFTATAYADFSEGIPGTYDVKQTNVTVNTWDGANNEHFGIFDRFTHFIDGWDLSTDEIISTDGSTGIFAKIANSIRELIIFVAVLFLFTGVLKLFFSDMSEDARVSWRKSLIWITLGIIIMGIAPTVWNILFNNDVEWMTAGRLYYSVIEKLIQLLQFLGWFGFIAMMVYAFYVIVTAGGQEDALKKWKNTVIYAVFGFILLKVPEILVKYVYGDLHPNCRTFTFSLTSCKVRSEQSLDGAGIIGIFAQIFNYVNGFLFLLCVLLVLYAGWLVFISGWDDEKLKQAKKTIIYAGIGLIILVASLAIFRFFIMEGNIMNV